jgi:hypothetical protein
MELETIGQVTADVVITCVERLNDTSTYLPKDELSAARSLTTLTVPAFIYAENVKVVAAVVANVWETLPAAEVAVRTSAVVPPNGSVVAIVLAAVALVFPHAASSNCSVLVSKFTRADTTGLLVAVGWVAWLPGSSRTEMFEIVEDAPGVTRMMKNPALDDSRLVFVPLT